MISEFALVPDIFEASTGCSGAAHDACMAQLTELFLNEGMVRDLRRGEWRRTVLGNAEQLTTAGRQLFQTLVSSNRLREFVASPLAPPSSPEEWLWEAHRSQKLGMHDRSLVATLAHPELVDREADPFVVSIQSLHAATWWKSRSSSMRLQRRTSDYIQHLKPLFRYSNSLLFIDPNLHPGKPGYAQFGELVRSAVHSEGKPDLIEIHRSCKDSGGSTVREQYPTRSDWITKFSALGRELATVGLRATIFIWEDFHDRYCISNLMGLSIPYGFDICTDVHRQQARTTWTKLGRRDADEIRRDFDRSNQERLHCESFDIGDDS
jgi:hypothetical protein